MEREEKEEKKEKESTKAWLQRIGWAGVLFFVIKGTITSYLIFKAGSCAFN